MRLVSRTIGARIFGAFIAMSAIIAVMGLAGYMVLSAAGDIAVDTFDGPLMAINYARAAQTDFANMKLAELRYEHAGPGKQAAIAAEIADIAGTFSDDLDVAVQRSHADDEVRAAGQIRPLVAQWRAIRARGDIAELEQLDGRIDDAFDQLVEYHTDHSYVGRRQTGDNIAGFKYAVIAMTVLALLLAAGITWLLRSHIVRPLRAAAIVADRIAKGEMQTPIPQGGADETGALLNSMTVMQTNIRERIQRETELRRSAENRLVEALETSREGVMLTSPDGRIAMSNSALRGFFPKIAYQLMPGQAFDTALAAIQGQLAPTQVASADVETSGHAELELADGRWLRMTVSRTSEGGSIIFLSDFTAIKEREDSLRRAKAEAERANASKTRFLANMSHELRTPLNAIIGFSEIINGQLFGPLGSEKYVDYSSDVLRSGRHLLAVINDVLDLSKSEAGRMSMSVREMDMRDVLEDCATMVREQCAAAGLAFQVAGIDTHLPMTGDPAKLRQIFLNLLSNAIKFTEKGGTVSLSARADGGGIAVTVADTGIGMDPQDVEVAFQPFAQVDNRLERRYEGTGLGLPLTKALVDLHEGAMAIDSARGQGTRITVTFPRAIAGELAEAV
jgi:signal transduction histidine kinase